jgi:hypothetical protein
MELCIKVNGNKETDMAMEFKFGQTVQSMKGTGKIIKLMEKENFGMLMEMFLMVNGKKTKQMEKALMSMLMELVIKVNG